MRRAWGLLAAACTLAFLIVVSVISVVRARQEQEIASVTIIGKTHLMAQGDTATWCGLIVLKNGEYRLGRPALSVVAMTDTTIVAAKVVDAAKLCAPLLRARGLNEHMPLTDMEWNTTRGKSGESSV